MSYKRITEKRNGKNVIPLLNSVCGVDLPKWTIAEESDIRQYLSGDAVDKFAELEDKIENGTLIELPCLLAPYYLSGEWHCKILKEFDEHSVPCMEYFHGKTKEEVKNKAEKKLESLKNATKI